MDEGKLNAARKALEYVKDGMVIGLGSGSTAEIFVGLLGEKAKREGLELTCIPTSVRTAKLARKAGLRTRLFAEGLKIDLAVDGADQVDPKLNLIKGYGGAMLRERIIDYGAKRFIVIIDQSKLRKVLEGRLPLEVKPDFAGSVIERLKGIGMKAEVRSDGKDSFITDNGNVIVDIYVRKLGQPKAMDKKLRKIDGVIETGLFAGGVWLIIVGLKKGTKEIRNQK